MEIVQLFCLVIALYSGVVHSWGASTYRGGTISYKTNESSMVEFNYRMAFDRSYVFCDNSSTGHSVHWSLSSSSSLWTVESYTYYGSSSFDNIRNTNSILCSDSSSEDNWSEGKNTFWYNARHDGVSLKAQTYNYGNWIGNISRDVGYGSMMLRAIVNSTITGVFNNSSPVSSLPLTVYVQKGTPSIIRIPVDDPDGDIVRCRKASYQECYRGMCTYFPYGVLDEGENCTLSYNGSGSTGQRFPIILKLEDFPRGTTQFDSSNSLGSVDLQFIVHIVRVQASVRIQGGGSSGLLQVFYSGVWGTVCGDGWSMTNTHVVCRQLGFAGGLSYRTAGGETGQIWLDDVRCSGSERTIEQCNHRWWGIHDCQHPEDVHVSCYHNECTSYTVLNSYNRALGYRGTKNKCDKNDLPNGWYRFMGDAGTAIATSCAPLLHCGTAAPGWMNGFHPTPAEGVVNRKVCYHWNTNCCSLTNNIRVRNCGGFYVYELNRPQHCNLRYCGNNTETNNTCVSSPCRNGATCIETDSSYNCSCPHGYTGRHCETIAVARATNCWHTTVTIHYTVGPFVMRSVSQSEANSIMIEVLNHGRSQLLCPGLALNLLEVTIATPGNSSDITGGFGAMHGENLNSTQKQISWSCLKNAVIFNDIVLRPHYYTNPLKGKHFADRASLTKYQDTTCCSSGAVSSNGACDNNNTCTSSPCRNNGTCVTTYYGYRCNCPHGYSGQQCETNTNQCYSSPCRNGGTCRGDYYWYSCSCPNGYTGRQCESNLKTNITCGENYMQMDLKDSYFSDIDWRNLHLKDPSCRARRTGYTRSLRTPLDSCGTTYTENKNTIVFWNEIQSDNRYQGVGNGSNISRDRKIILPFFCSYERRRFVSTTFSPSKKTVIASEGSYGNFTFTMDLYRNSNYSTPYSPFAYPVVVHPNQPLWVQYEVKNTNTDLVVFAENCRATTSSNPDSYPQHVFLERGCVRDPTMVYWYNPYSRVQRFSIRSFRFVYSNTFLVYLHCELIVCHRNSTNSRCARGCISPRGRRETADMDGSELYDLSAGPLKGGKMNADSNEQEGSLTSKQLIGGLGAVGGLFFLVTILLSTIIYRKRRRGPEDKPINIALDVTVNSYEQDDVDGDEKPDNKL